MRLSVKEILFKGKDMISAAQNPPFFRYRVNHYLKKPVPFKQAKKWANKNRRFYADKGIETIWFETYDGSDQVCHPDIAIWNAQYWMVATPYPYGMEEYENPSLLCGSQMTDMRPVNGNPIASPSQKGYGSHLSDPCLLADGGNLYCFYRDTVNHGESVENRICYKTMCEDLRLSSEKVLMTSFEDGLLSPAVLRVENELCLFYVSYMHGECLLTQSVLSEDMTIKPASAKTILSPSDDWNTWHFDVKATDDGIAFLLLQRSKKDRKKFKLQKGCFDLDTRQIIIKEDVRLPGELREVMEHPYKSCMIPNSNQLLLSFRDKNAVYVTKIIEMGER